jgi:hypothetical protein
MHLASSLPPARRLHNETRLDFLSPGNLSSGVQLSSAELSIKGPLKRCGCGEIPISGRYAEPGIGPPRDRVLDARGRHPPTPGVPVRHIWPLWQAAIPRHLFCRNRSLQKASALMPSLPQAATESIRHRFLHLYRRFRTESLTPKTPNILNRFSTS